MIISTAIKMAQLGKLAATKSNNIISVPTKQMVRRKRQVPKVNKLIKLIINTKSSELSMLRCWKSANQHETN